MNRIVWNSGTERWKNIKSCYVKEVDTGRGVFNRVKRGFQHVSVVGDGETKEVWEVIRKQENCQALHFESKTYLFFQDKQFCVGNVSARLVFFSTSCFSLFDDVRNFNKLSYAEQLHAFIATIIGEGTKW